MACRDWQDIANEEPNAHGHGAGALGQKERNDQTQWRIEASAFSEWTPKKALAEGQLDETLPQTTPALGQTINVSAPRLCSLSTVHLILQNLIAWIDCRLHARWKKFNSTAPEMCKPVYSSINPYSLYRSYIYTVFQCYFVSGVNHLHS